MHTVVTVSQADARALSTSLATSSTSSLVLDFLRMAVWQLFDATSDQSIKFHLGFVPVSIKVAKLEPLIVQWVGARV